MMTTATRQHSVLETNESPEIRPVDPDKLWLHGTRAPCFDTPRPATCFTRDPFIATSFSLTGSYQAPRSQHGERRVLSATIDLPEGAPIMRMSLEFDQYLAMVDSTKVFCPADQEDRAKQQREMRATYHQAAAERASELGYRTYFADLYHPDEETARVTLDASAVTSAQHHAHFVNTP